MIVIIGATGHVGANLTRALIDKGREVRVLVREDRRAVEGLDVEVVGGDVLDTNSLIEAFRGAEVVFHLAAKISMYRHDEVQMVRVNVEGTRNVIKACLECGVERLVYFSSIHTLSPYPKDEVIDETRSLLDERKLTLYDRTKAMAEEEIKNAATDGLDAVIISPTAIIGPYDFKPSYVGKTLLELYHGRVPALVDGGFNWVDVRDVVTGAIAAWKDGKSGERYILSGKWLTVAEICEVVRNVTGHRVPEFVVPMWLARFAAPPVTVLSRLLGKSPLFTSGSLYVLRHYRFISHDKATRELQYHPRPITDTVRDVFRWFKDYGYLEERSI